MERRPDGTPVHADLNYTEHARKSFERVVRDPYFRDEDPEIILEALTGEIRAVSFGEYLLRYMVRKYRFEEADPEETVRLTADRICAEFGVRGVPASFTPTTAKLRNLAKNWLTQRMVRRSAVLLLGFGLGMTDSDVNAFLAKALKEPMLNPKDPFEVLCWYCYRYGLPYARFEALWEKWQARAAGNGHDPDLLSESTVRIRPEMNAICTESQLDAYLSRLKMADGTLRQSVAARRQFDLLYSQACEYAASVQTVFEKDDAGLRALRRGEELSRNDRLYDFQKAEILKKERGRYKTWTAEEIIPADIERILYTSVPKDRNGNLLPMKLSRFRDLFPPRMTRQHITDLREGRAPVTRFDIATLCLVRAAAEAEGRPDAQKRYEAFIADTNRALAESDMPPLYVANPYECFLLMCSLSPDPLGSFADVWGIAFEAENETET